MLTFDRSRQLGKRAHALIPGGAHTYAKGDDQYPMLAPGFISHGLGCRVWDVDGNDYIEFGQGNRAVGLGHAHPAVVEAAARELSRGSNFVRPAAIEVEAAETFLAMIDGAAMVKFCKNGSDATSAAMKLARAHTGRDLIAICADHPFFSSCDWFMGTTAVDAGVTEATKRQTLSFRYNDLASVTALFETYPWQVAGLILEPAKNDDPKDDFLAQTKQLCHDNGALFILDEMITGFRWHNGGGQKYYGVVPDLSCFGKALANGFSVSALAGKREVMRLGGLDHDRERVFLLSTTHGGETHALAAAIATMNVYRDEPVIAHLNRQGLRLKVGIDAAIRRHALDGFVEILGKPCCLVFAARDRDRRPSQEFRTLLMQETIQRGVIAPSLVVSYAHGDNDIDRTIEAFDGALAIYARALEDGVAPYLVGPPTQPVYRRYNQSPEPAPVTPRAAGPEASAPRRAQNVRS